MAYTGEVLVGPRKTLFMDEISSGLDSSTTFQIVKAMGDLTHLSRATILMSLLQPAPEARCLLKRSMHCHACNTQCRSCFLPHHAPATSSASHQHAWHRACRGLFHCRALPPRQTGGPCLQVYNLFDDIMLLSDGIIAYHGPREGVVPFFSGLGFRCPTRKGVPDFLQEVTSRKDQQQYWTSQAKPWAFVPGDAFAAALAESESGKASSARLAQPFDRKDAVAKKSLVQDHYHLLGELPNCPVRCAGFEAQVYALAGLRGC